METKLKTITDEQKKKKMLAGIFLLSLLVSPQSQKMKTSARGVFIL